MPEEQDTRIDSPGSRVEAILKFAGALFPTDFRRLTDEAITHSGQASRSDPASANQNWRPLGPRNLGGRIRSLAQDERNPNIVFAGSAQGGLWRTQDSGDSWTALDNFTPPNVRQSLAIGAIGLSYINPQIIYVGSGEPTRSAAGGNSDISGNGLFWSTNSGSLFTQIDHPDPATGTIGSGQYETIVVDPWEPKRFWIATSDRGIGRGTPPTAPVTVPLLQRDNVTHAAAPAAGSQQATDIMVDFGSSRNAPPTLVTVYVALWANGVYRAQYNRNTDRYISSAGVTWTQITPAFPASFTRIKLAQCRSQPNWIAAVSAIAANAASNVFISSNRGGIWIDTGSRAAVGDTGTQARYDLLLGMHPSNPAIFITGSVELFLGTHNVVAGTTAWTRIINWTRHDRGDRAQHADQHALLFDAANPRRIWVGNDGGVATSPDLGGRWRERGLGIDAAQFYDITTHPSFPYIFAGGLQDNGTWLSYGGQTWFHVNGADGGDVAFNPTDPRRFIATWQSGLDQSLIQSTTNAIGSADYMNRLPDVAQSAGNDVNHQAILTPLTAGFAAVHTTPFIGVIAAHPTQVNHVITGRAQAAYLSINGTNFTQLSTTNPLLGIVSDVVYSTQNPNTNWWISTDQGELYFTSDANATPLANVSPPGLAGSNASITGIAVNPNNDVIVAVAVTLRVAAGNSQGRVFLSGDSGQNWCEISGRVAPCTSSAANQFNPSAATAIVFDPSSSATVANPQTLYVGCLAGIYVIRNAIAPTTAGASFTPQWRTFNGSLPLSLIFDLETVQYIDGAGQPQQLLRCATYGRGAYECDLAGANRVALLIRDNIVDDGRSYAAAHQLPNNHDPRMSPGATAVMVLNRSIDMRIDIPPYRFLGSVIDGLELDELLRSDELAAGILNIVYVQVHNTGFGQTNSAKLHLFYARAAAAPPDLQATFWNQFPNVQDGGTWQKVASLNIDFLESGQPRVMAFNWQVPGDLTGNIALLAVATDPTHDALNGSALSNVVDPAQANSFIGTERRTALFVTPVTASPGDVSLRDGFDDTGLFGETAWGTQSHDIIVVQAPEATPAVTFADQNNLRSADVLDGSATNHIYVRVHNRGGSVINNAQVELFQLNVTTMRDPNSWTSIGTANLANVAANTSAIFPAITWVNPPDPAPNTHQILIALLAADGDPRPDFIARISSIQTFWKMILEEVDSGNAVVRGIKWQA